MIFGRDGEISEVADLLDEWSLVTLVGPGGVGKTTLERAAAERAGRFDFVDLSSIGGPDLKEAIAGDLGYATFEDLARSSHGDRLVLVDNCEHVLDAAADFVDAFLADGHGRVLATSREPVGSRGERIYRLQPMSTDGHPSQAGLMLDHLMRARGLDSRFDMAELDALAAQLDGIPLALELAAARATTMSPKEIAVHLRDRLDLLSRRQVRGPKRHQSLDAAIAWSYDLLEESQRSALVHLAVFDGAFNLSCAGAAMDSDDTDALEVLQGLVERSLLTTTATAGQTWYRLYDTVRVFCRGLISEQDARSTVGRVVERATALAFELTFPQETEHRLETQESVAVLYPIWREAIEWCLEHEDEPDAALAMVAPLWWMEDIGHQLEIAGLIELVLQRWPTPMDEARATAIAVQSTLLRVSNRSEEAARKASSLLAERGGGHGVALALRTAGMSARADGRFEEAIELLLSGIEEASTIGFDALALELQMHVALAEARAGLLEEAVARLRLALAAGDVTGLTLPWLESMLSYLLLVSNPDEAWTVLEDLEAGHYGPLDPWSEGTVKEQIGSIHAMRGDVAQAARAYADALGTFYDYHILPGQILVVWGAAALMARTGAPDWERRLIATARDLFGSPAIGDFENDRYEAVAGHRMPDAEGTGVSLSRVRSQLERLAETDSPAATPLASQARFKRKGDTWLVALEGSEAHVRDSKGMTDLAKLLANPGTEIGALDLMGSTVTAGGTGQVLDTEARTQYRRRLRELNHDIEQAEAMGAGDEAERLRGEMEQIVAQLSSAYGLGGRARSTGDPAEKARSAVTWRIRSAIKRIGEQNELAGDHLSRFVSTGRFCVYDPPHPVDWQF